LDKGEIKAKLLTDDIDLQERINRHPMLHWKAMNVKKRLGKSQVKESERVRPQKVTEGENVIEKVRTNFQPHTVSQIKVQA